MDGVVRVRLPRVRSRREMIRARARFRAQERARTIGEIRAIGLEMDELVRDLNARLDELEGWESPEEIDAPDGVLDEAEEFGVEAAREVQRARQRARRLGSRAA